MASQELIGKQKRWIWPFELLERIGEGGMGEVYRARFVKNDRIVAVKLLPSDIDNASILARFAQEMKILRSLRHPNIVHCFGGVCESEQQFYAMELVEGGTLSDVLRKQGRISVDRTIEYARQMCAALTYAHERGVVHRDLKPGNFLVTPDGTLKLSDFGLATIAAGRKITADDRTVGTFTYMAPEQITGKPPVSPQTDLYALGCVLFELLSGAPPFRGQTSGEVLHKHLSEEPPRLASVVMSCPAGIDELVSRLLSKQPADRPASAKEVAAEIVDCGNSVTVVDRRASLIAQALKEPKRPEPIATAQAADTSSSRKREFPRWLLAVGAVVIVLLLMWNRRLAESAAAFERTETLLIELLDAENQHERLMAADLLGRIAPDSDAAVAALIQSLENEDPTTRRAAAVALGEAGAAGWDARFALTKMQKLDDRPYVRTAAADSLKKIKAAPRGSRWWLWLLLIVIAFLAGAGLWFRHRLAAFATPQNPHRPSP